MPNLPDNLRLPWPLDQPAPIRRGPRRLATGAIILLVLAIYFAALSPHWSISKDSGLYLNLARNLARGDGYTLAGRPHTHVAPGFPLLLSELMRLGAGSFLALNTVMMALGLVTLVVIYLLLRQLVASDWAVLLTGTIALSQEMLQRSGEILSDVPAMLLVTTALWLYLRGVRTGGCRRGWEAGSLMLIAAVWFRIAVLPIAAGAALGLVLSGAAARKRAVANAAIVAAGLVATAIFFWACHRAHSDPLAATYAWHLTELAEGRTNPFASFYFASGQLSRLVTCQGLPLWLAMIVLIVPIVMAMVRRARCGDWIGPLAVTFYLAGLSLATSTPRTRYLLAVMPLAVLYLVEGYAWIAARLTRRRTAAPASSRQAGTIMVVAVAVVMLGMNLPLVGRRIYLIYQADYASRQSDGDWGDTIAIAEFLRAQGQPGPVLGGQPLAYLANRPAPPVPRPMWPTTPTPAQLDKLLEYWAVRYVVFDHEQANLPFFRALRDYLNRRGAEARAFGRSTLLTVPRKAQPSTQPQ